MSTYKSALRSTLKAERKAYGFTLVIWGGATVTSGVQGPTTTLEGISYVGGALAAMAAVILLTVHVAGAPDRPESDRLALGAIHAISVACAIGGAWLAAELVRPVWLAYLVAGAVVTTAYQLLAALVSTLTAPEH